MTLSHLLLIALLAGIVFASARCTPEATRMADRQPYGALPDGSPAEIFTLTNRHGAQARVTNYGGIVVSLTVPDREGQMGDVVLGYDDLDGYLQQNPYFGSIVGRYGNRIGNASFVLGTDTFRLASNNGVNHIHGGVVGFDKILWRPEDVSTPEAPAVRLTYRSPDGEEGYPGNLDVAVTYSFNDRNELRIDYEATTDRETIVNLTNHSYFNLSGAPDILGHEMMIEADHITPVDAGLIPTGALLDVTGTPFDFRQPSPIGARIGDPHEQMVLGRGYDHNYVLDGTRGELKLAARVYEPATGRVMEVLTTQPGVQFYSGNFLNGSITGKGGTVYGHRSGFCLETQHFPDSPNKPQFPSTLLRPGDTYRHTTVYRFSAE
jgi:aldose 1-epimerase